MAEIPGQQAVQQLASAQPPQLVRSGPGLQSVVGVALGGPAEAKGPAAEMAGIPATPLTPQNQQVKEFLDAIGQGKYFKILLDNGCENIDDLVIASVSLLTRVGVARPDATRIMQQIQKKGSQAAAYGLPIRGFKMPRVGFKRSLAEFKGLPVLTGIAPRMPPGMIPAAFQFPPFPSVVPVQASLLQGMPPPGPPGTQPPMPGLQAVPPGLPLPGHYA